MDLNILGLKIRLEVILVTIILVWLIGGYTICSCSKVSSVKEGFQALGAEIGWRTGKGVPGDTWDMPSKGSTKDLFQSLDGIQAGQVPLPDDQMFLFYANKFDPKCCFKPQQYSSSTGCACISREQMEFLNQRGGNRTHPTTF